MFQRNKKTGNTNDMGFLSPYLSPDSQSLFPCLKYPVPSCGSLLLHVQFSSTELPFHFTYKATLFVNVLFLNVLFVTTHDNAATYSPIPMGPGSSRMGVLLVLTVAKQSAPAVKGILAACKLVYCWRAGGKTRAFPYTPEQLEEATEEGKMAGKVGWYGERAERDGNRGGRWVDEVVEGVGLVEGAPAPFLDLTLWYGSTQCKFACTGPSSSHPPPRTTETHPEESSGTAPCRIQRQDSWGFIGRRSKNRTEPLVNSWEGLNVRRNRCF